MPGENLTRVEARERAAVLSTQSYAIDLNLATGPELFRVETTVHFTATPGAASFIDLIAERVLEIELNGQSIDPETVFADARVKLNDLREDNVLRIVSDQRYTNTGEGLHRFVDPVDGETYLYSQFEVPDSRRVFAVFEQPDLKATFQFTVTAPARWQIVSNQPTPESVSAGETDGEALATWAFSPTPIMSSYITALIAGPYSVVRDELTSTDGRTIPLGVFCRASLSEHLDADYIFEKTRQGFAFFEGEFNYPYPFEKYDQLFVPEFNAGAMENIGAVTFTEAYVFRSQVTDSMRERRVVTILHELAHMWFGDLVTMRWWNDLWLNESFAEYMSTLATAEATEWSDCWTTFAASEKSWAYRQDQLPSTHPIVAEIRDLEDVLVNFDGITYAKGASVLKQLVAWVGREPFMRGVHEYFVKHSYKNTELSDLLSELTAQSGRDLTEWSAKWLETAGVNTLRARFTVDSDGVYTSFAVEQSAHPEYPTLRPHRIAVGLYDLESGSLRRVHRAEVDTDGAVTELPELIGHKRPALLLLNDDDLSYAKIRFDEDSLNTAVAQLGSFADPLARSVTWGALWDATRDGEFPGRRFIDVVLTHLERETNSTVLRTLLQQMHLTAAHYVSPEHRESSLSHIGDALWEMAQRAAAGSDLQFQLVRVFANIARTAPQLDTVAQILDETTPMNGLDIDTDLGWELLISLVAGGRATTADIDAALASDPTASGEQSAAHARAALPDAASKATAWTSVFEDDSPSNLVVRATGIGWSRVHDLELLEPYIAKYFASIQGIWDSRSYAIAEELITGFYPSELANTALRDATVAWLTAHTAAPDALRRLVTENLAGVERSLNAQLADQTA